MTGEMAFAGRPAQATEPQAQRFLEFLGTGCRPFIIGEVGQAHDGSLGTAHAFIDAIADAGAHAVKFQTHIAQYESTPDEPWRVAFSRQDATRYDYWKRMEFSADQWLGLRQHATDRGLKFISSPFSVEAVELLVAVKADALKIASGEMPNHELLLACADSKLPVLLSSGMSPWHEIDAAVAAVNQCAAPYGVMQCTSAYPCGPGDWGLNVLSVLKSRYQCPVGFSDHSGTIYAGLAAVALGAQFVEVHVTLSRRAFGPDVPASLTPGELQQLCEGSALVATAIEMPVDKDKMASEMQPMRMLFTRSAVASHNLPEGHVIAEGDLIAKKPGTGIPSHRIGELLGRRLARPLRTDQLVSWEDFID